MQVGFKPAPRTLVLAICEEQSLLRALASLELAWVHFQLFDLMKENQLLGPVLAEERLNLSSVHAMSGLASPRTDCCVSRNGRIQREWLRHASLRRQVAVTWAAALFITGSTNPFSDPMAAWSFALSHAVASGAAIACGPYECQGSRLVLFARCAQTAPHAQSLSADSGSLPGDSQQGYSLPLPVDAVSHQVPWAGKFAGFHVHFKFGRVRRLWQNRRVRRPCRAAAV